MVEELGALDFFPMNKRAFLLFGIFLLVSIDALIVFNVNLLRPVFVFITFIILPGLLFLQVLKVNRLSFWETLLYSIALSLSLLMFSGLLANTVLPGLGVSKPLTLDPILIMSNLLVFGLIVALQALGEKRITLPSFPLPRFENNASRLLFFIPFLFPLLSIIGTWLMNSFSFNLVSLALVLAIAVHFLAIILLRKKLPSEIYPVTILLASLSLVLLLMLRTNHVFGWDIHGELMFFRHALNRGIWELELYGSAYNSVLSVTILPAVIELLSGVGIELVFKLIMPFFFSLFPLTVYLLVKKQTNRLLAFMAVFFLISQASFLALIPSLIRQSLAMFFLGLFFLVSLNEKMSSTQRNALAIIFMFSLIVSHYTTAYLIIFLLAFSFILLKGLSLKDKSLEFNSVRTASIALFFIIVFFWYAQLASAPVGDLKNIFSFIFDKFTALILGETSLSSFSLLGAHQTASPIVHYLHLFVGTLTKLFLLIGIIHLVKNFKQLKLRKDYLLMGLITLGFLLIQVLNPELIYVYNMDRFYILVIMLVGFAFVLGAGWVAQKFSVGREKAFLLAAVLLAVYFLLQTQFLDEVLGENNSYLYHSDSKSARMFLVSDQEKAGAEWLARFNPEKVYGDRYNLLKVWGYTGIPYPESVPYNYTLEILEEDNTGTPKKGFLFLGQNNLQEKKLWGTKGSGSSTTEIDEFTNLERQDKLYTNLGAELYYLH